MSKAIRAVSAGKLKKLKQIVKDNALIVNQCNRDGYTALSTAISYQQYEIIDYLLNDDNIDVNAGNNNITPIFTALNTNHENIAIQLIDNGANPNTLFPNNTSIIHYCIQSNYLRLIRKLFKNPSFNYKIISQTTNENIFHIIVDTHNAKLLSNIINLIENKNDIKTMINSLNNSNHTPLWKCIEQNQLEMAQIMLNIGYANINYICYNNQTISHLIYELYPNKTGPFHKLLIKYNADLTITDINGHRPNDIIALMEFQNECDKEEQLLMEETIKMREKLKHSRVINKRKHDKLLNIWLNKRKLNKTEFSNVLLIKNIKWNEFMILSDDEMYEIIQNYCSNMNDNIIQNILNEWNESKTEYINNILEKKKQKRIKMKKKLNKKESEEILESKINELKELKKEKLICDKYVKQFLKDFGLLELEFIFAKQKINMTQLSEINNIWISKYIIGNSFHVNNLKMRLKLGIKELRKEIVKEMKAKIKKDYEQKYGNTYKNKLKNRNNLRRKLNRIHPLLGKLEAILSDPLYLLSIGFVIFVIFTFVLFVIVGYTEKKTV